MLEKNLKNAITYLAASLLVISCGSEDFGSSSENRPELESTESESGSAITSSTAITTLLLIDADTNEVLFPIGEANLIDLSQLPPNLTIQAITSPDEVGSVQFELDALSGSPITENIPPYALFGDDAGDFNGGTLPLNPGRLVVTPFSGRNGTGTAGASFDIQLNVIQSD